MNLKYEKIFKSFAFHNIIGHPLMQFLIWAGKKDLAEKVHNITLPTKQSDDVEIKANSESDDPEAYRVLKD